MGGLKKKGLNEKNTQDSKTRWNPHPEVGLRGGGQNKSNKYGIKKKTTIKNNKPKVGGAAIPNMKVVGGGERGKAQGTPATQAELIQKKKGAEEERVGGEQRGNTCGNGTSRQKVKKKKKQAQQGGKARKETAKFKKKKEKRRTGGKTGGGMQKKEGQRMRGGPTKKEKRDIHQHQAQREESPTVWGGKKE